MSDSSVRFQVFFSGHVQGVGFRYSTLQIAKGFEVSGWVENLADGRVHVEVEGRERDCRDFIREIQEEMKAMIRETDLRSEGPVEARNQGFHIRR